MPTLPASRFSHVVLAPMPSGEITPIPVTTTRLIVGSAGRTILQNGPHCGPLQVNLTVQPIGFQQLRELFRELKIMFWKLEACQILIDVAEHQFDLGDKLISTGHST